MWIAWPMVLLLATDGFLLIAVVELGCCFVIVWGGARFWFVLFVGVGFGDGVGLFVFTRLSSTALLSLLKAVWVLFFWRGDFDICSLDFIFCGLRNSG